MLAVRGMVMMMQLRSSQITVMAHCGNAKVKGESGERSAWCGPQEGGGMLGTLQDHR
jgi:hypothetical protein